MNCCHRCVTAAHFNAAVAQRDLRRFQRRGPDAPTRQLLAAVQARPLPPEPTLLDIGGGVGTIHHILLERGFGKATQVEASDAYLAVAAEEARRLGHADRVRFQLAEFPPDDASVAVADVVTLHRVVCCYPDYTRLLEAAANCARSTLVFSYPRGRWLNRLSVVCSNAGRRLMGRAFRAYVHPPERMKAVLENAGMRQAWKGGTWVWAVEVFERAA